MSDERAPDETPVDGAGAPETPPAEAGEQHEERHGVGAFLRELPVLILIAFGLALLIKTFFIQAFYIPSGSMEPTLIGCAPCPPGVRADRVLVNKLVYRFRDPRRGEIIVFAEPPEERRQRSFLEKVRAFLAEGLGTAQPAERDFIKRVIGLPGETIHARNGQILITPPGGKRFRLEEPYLHPEKDTSPFGPRTLGPDEYFVMGDNRLSSADSRSRLGPIPKDRIVGKAFVRIWPPSRLDVFRRPSYDGAGALAFLPFVAAGTRLRSGRRGRRVSSEPWTPTAGSSSDSTRRASAS